MLGQGFPTAGAGDPGAVNAPDKTICLFIVIADDPFIHLIEDEDLLEVSGFCLRN
jgi:hypothetical protein